MSDEIAESLDAGDVCAAAVRADELLEATVRAINAGQVPAAYQEDLTAHVNTLVNEVNCARPETTTEDEAADDEDVAEDKDKEKKEKEKPKDDEDDDPADSVPTDIVPTGPVPTETGE